MRLFWYKYICTFSKYPTWSGCLAAVLHWIIPDMHRLLVLYGYLSGFCYSCFDKPFGFNFSDPWIWVVDSIPGFGLHLRASLSYILVCPFKGPSYQLAGYAAAGYFFGKYLRISDNRRM